MKYNRVIGCLLALLIGLALAAGMAPKAMAHCDAMDGPVVLDAQKALEKGDVNYALKWVKPEYEAKVTAAFDKALAARASGPGKAGQTDTAFYDELVAAHRASEGEPYTGLKPAGYGETPALRAADQALDDGSIDRVLALVPAAARPSVIERYRETMARKDYDVNNVDAGREYVEAYIKYIHTVTESSAAGDTVHAV